MCAELAASPDHVTPHGAAPQQREILRELAAERRARLAVHGRIKGDLLLMCGSYLSLHTLGLESRESTRLKKLNN